MKRFYIYPIFLFLSVLCSSACAAQEHFMTITDIHFNPFYACATSPCKLIQDLNREDVSQWRDTLDKEASKTISPYGKDTNYALLKSALIQVHNVAQQQQPKFAILIGDYLGHNYQAYYRQYSGDESQQGYQTFVQKTLQFLTDEIHSALPNTAVYPALGNNDSYNGDYYSNPKGSFYHATSIIWSALFLNPHNKTTFLDEFPIGGYYNITPPSSNDDRIIVLNSVLFSTAARGRGVGAAALKELNWLHQKLSQAQTNQQKVWLVFHIPIGIDVYKTLLSRQTTSLWQSPYTQQFLSLLSQFSNTITGIFTSHLHMDAFALFNRNGGAEIFDSFTPAISPMFANNPGFKVFTYNNHTFQVNNFVTYYLAINSNKTNRLNDQQWQLLYDFNNTYQPTCSNCLLIHGMDNLQKNNTLVQNYKYYYATGNPNGQPINTDPMSWPYYWCAISHFTPSNYEGCVDSIRRVQKNKKDT